MAIIGAGTPPPLAVLIDQRMGQPMAFVDIHDQTIERIANAIIKKQDKPLPDSVRKLIEQRLKALEDEIGYEKYSEAENELMIAEREELQAVLDA